jgi:4-amino-4-deoxy-L-arabinose transferase-like glycosyltransferase
MRKTVLTITAILILVLLTRLVFVMTYRDGNFNPSGKMKSWSHIALNLASGEGYVYYSEAPTARRGPVPVLFLASLFYLFGPDAFPVTIVVSQWLWDAGSAVLIYFVAMDLFGRRQVAFLAMVMFALHPVIVENSARANVEPLATFLLLAFVLTFLRALRNPEWFRFVWPGIFLGLAILSLATLQFFPVLAVGLIIVTLRVGRQRTLVAIATLCLCTLVVWSPWIIRNRLALGKFVPVSTLGGHNLLRDHYTLGETDYLRFRDTTEYKSGEKELFSARGIDLSRLSEVQQDRLFREVALDFIRAYPNRYVVLSVPQTPVC